MAPYLKNIAIVGAGGRMGGFIVEALVKQGEHNVTALTREGGGADMPDGLAAVKKVDYASHESLVAALDGQDALVITLNVAAPRDTQQKLVRAAVDAGVKYVVPNEWGGDASNAKLTDEAGLGTAQVDARRFIDEAAAAAAATGAGAGGRLRWLAVACGFWYEFSLGGTEARYGFDFARRRLTLFDDGRVETTHSTWAQVGRAVAALLALPADGPAPSLAAYAGTAVPIDSFHISQRDMFDSVLRVTGASEADWTVMHESSRERWQRAKDLRESGNPLGFVRQLYTRTFFPDDPSDFHARVQNKALGLPEESLDEATRIAIQIAEQCGDDPFATMPVKK